MNERSPPDCTGITKTHFALCRVNVYVDSRGIEFNKEKGNRILTFHQRSMVALADSRREKMRFQWRGRLQKRVAAPSSAGSVLPAR